MAKIVITAGWNDCPHLTPEAIASMEKEYPPHELEARKNGAPSIGSGQIYPLSEDQFVIGDFPIPDHFPRAYGMDVGWNRTAAVFGAWDQDLDMVYIYSEHYAGEAIPAIHAEAIKARGKWIPGVIDPAARGRSQIDGARLVEIYKAQELDLEYANNAVSAGIYEVWQRLVSGRLKVFASCGSLRGEMKLYRRDEKGQIVKKNDHACFDGSTRVITSEGPKAISDLVGTSGKVLSIDGAWRDYEDCRLIQRHAPVIELSFDNGDRVVCTPDHLFLTESGWIKAGQLDAKEYPVMMATRARKNAARENARARCLAIRDAGERDVYCLTVPATGTFAIESGLLVHNCDGLRYFIMSGLARAIAKPAAPSAEENDDYAISDYGGTGWMS